MPICIFYRSIKFHTRWLSISCVPIWQYFELNFFFFFLNNLGVWKSFLHFSVLSLHSINEKYPLISNKKSPYMGRSNRVNRWSYRFAFRRSASQIRNILRLVKSYLGKSSLKYFEGFGYTLQLIDGKRYISLLLHKNNVDSFVSYLPYICLYVYMFYMVLPS